MAIAAAQALAWLAPAAGVQEIPAGQPSAPASQPADLASPPPARKPFSLRVIDLYTGMETDFQSRRVRSETISGADAIQKNRDLRLKEYVGVGLAGDIGDPNLFDWRAGLEFGLTQGRFAEDLGGVHESGHPGGFLAEYDVNADILKSQPISFNAYARRRDDRVPRRFLPSLRETNTEAGVTGLAVTGPVTTEFGFTWRDVERTGNHLGEDDEELETSRAYADSTWQISQHQKLRLSFEHENQESDYQGSSYNFDLKRNELRAEHEVELGPGNRHRLDTFVRCDQESGSLGRDELNFVPRLTLQHTDKLRTVWRYNYDRVTQDVIDVEQHKFDAEALYQVTKNLRLSTDGFGLFEHADRDVDTTQWGLGGDIGYVRPSSLGETNVNLHMAYDELQTRGDAGRRLVRSEGHSLTDVRPVFLCQRNVVLATILAHSENYSRVFVAGVDYWAVRAAGRVSITRVPFGRIARDEIVYFDYLYDVPAGYGVDTWWTSFLLEHRFKCGLVPYYSMEGRFQDVDQGSLVLPIGRDDQDRHRIGTRFEREWWDVGAEYEIFDDSVEPYDAAHLTGHAALLRRADHSLDFSGELSRYWFDGESDRRRVWWAEMDVKDHLQIRQDLSMTTGTAFHFENNTVAGRTRGVDLEWGLKYVRGYLTVDLTLEYDLLATPENRDQGYGVFLNVRRNLSHLLPARGEPQ